MSDIFFGPIAIGAWIVASLVFTFCATWIWQIVRQVGGLLGTAVAAILSCLAVISVCFALILMQQPWIANWILGAVVSAAFVPIVIWSVVLTDLYAASRNSHRSFTAISYGWYQRVTKDAREERARRNPIAVNR